jgi:oxygen-independent coproporphyrinogen-3 oxidase
MRLSADLIFGWPGETLGDLEGDVGGALSLGARHLSVYALSVPPGSPLEGALASGSLPPVPSEGDAALMFLRAGEILAGRGLSRYEVSNFAFPGEECLHNLGYWTRGGYLGLGPSAHSFDGRVRRANHPDLGLWLSDLGAGRPPLAFSEELTPEQARLEGILLGLRLREGIALPGGPGGHLGQGGPQGHPGRESHRGQAIPEPRHGLGGRAGALVRDGFLVVRDGRLAPTEKGFLHADYLARELS